MIAGAVTIAQVCRALVVSVDASVNAARIFVEKRQANAKACGVGLTTCLGTHDQFKPLIGESRADIVCL